MDRQKFDCWFPAGDPQKLSDFCDLAIRRIDQLVQDLTDIQAKIELLFICGEGTRDFCVKLRAQSERTSTQKNEAIQMRYKFFVNGINSLFSKMTSIKFGSRGNIVTLLKTENSPEDILTYQMQPTPYDLILLRIWHTLSEQLRAYSNRQARIFEQYVDLIRDDTLKATTQDQNYIDACYERFPLHYNQFNLLRSNTYYERELEEVGKALLKLRDLQRNPDFPKAALLPEAIQHLKEYQETIPLLRQRDQNVRKAIRMLKSTDEVESLCNSP